MLVLADRAPRDGAAALLGGVVTFLGGAVALLGRIVASLRRAATLVGGTVASLHRQALLRRVFAWSSVRLPRPPIRQSRDAIEATSNEGSRRSSLTFNKPAGR